MNYPRQVFDDVQPRRQSDERVLSSYYEFLEEDWMELVCWWMNFWPYLDTEESCSL
jgi:hypothetical protein